MLRLFCICVCFSCIASAGTGRAEDKPTAKLSAANSAEFFEKQVRPILTAHCFSCHGEGKVKGGLRLTSRVELLKGGKSGPVIDLNEPDKSALVQAINYGDLRMPPKGKLPQSQIDTLTRWIHAGLPWPESAARTAAKHGPPAVDAQAKRFWSFQPLAQPPMPQLRNTDWAQNPIDAFVYAKLEQVKLRPAPPADKVALLRRVYYDLIGLPPAPAEVDAFLADASPQALEKVVDRLLDSHRYGEHWGRHWLDLVRYAESNSFERDNPKPFVWRYRDYVIRAFNADKPYDHFIREQLAGDELEPVQPDGIIATGFYRLGLWDDEPADPMQALYDDLDDIVATTGQVFLGLTVNCARCHDHKIDPFPQKDYYRLLAFFRGVRRYGVRSDESVADASLRPIGTEDDRERFKEAIAAHEQKLAGVQGQIAKIEKLVEADLVGVENDDFQYERNRESLVQKRVPRLLSDKQFQEYRGLRKQRSYLRRNPPKAAAVALCVTEAGPKAPQTYVLPRGNPHAKGDSVEPGFPTVLTNTRPNLPAQPPEAKTSGRRRVLADWIAGRDNALMARVIVNRVWQYHFGRGLVRSASNFGYGGTPPTHPELLDWLAGEFIRGGMRFKALHKQIILSKTYQMSSRGDAAALAKDPENDYFWRFNMRRLSAEEIRDSILAVCGNLYLKKTGGPSVYPTIPQEVLAGQSQPGKGWGRSSTDEMASRSVYVHSKRSLPLPILAAFDAAELDASCPVRFTTTQPTQALTMINSDFLNQQAQVLAADLKAKTGADLAAQLRLALRRVLQRPPTANEIERGNRLVAALQSEDRLSPDEALRRFCLLTLNLNEFVYLD